MTTTSSFVLFALRVASSFALVVLSSSGILHSRRSGAISVARRDEDNEDDKTSTTDEPRLCPSSVGHDKTSTTDDGPRRWADDRFQMKGTGHAGKMTDQHEATSTEDDGPQH